MMAPRRTGAGSCGSRPGPRGPADGGDRLAGPGASNCLAPGPRLLLGRSSC